MRLTLASVTGAPMEIPGRQTLAKAGAALVCAAASFALIFNAGFYDSFNSSYLMIVSAALLALTVLIRPRLLFCREFVLYAAFVGYMFVQLLWTPDVALALNTLFPAVDSMILLLLFGSLAAFHDLKAVIYGVLAGVLLGLAYYTYATGFPLTYPKEFSYNAVAGIYLFALFATLAFGCMAHSRVLPSLIAVVVMIHVAATTSIKTNLGIVLGAGVAGLAYLRYSFRLLRRNAVYLAIAAGLIGYAIVTDQALRDKVTAGLDRVSLGLRVLRVREDVAGYGGYGERQHWMQQGLRGWSHNPLFGNGVEAFRREFGITSHSTPIDVLYNSGAIGFLLYYGIFASLGWRLLGVRNPELRGIKALVFGTLVCYLFISLSGIVHYDPLLAAFVGMSAAILIRYSGRGGGPGVVPSPKSTLPPVIADAASGSLPK